MTKPTGWDLEQELAEATNSFSMYCLSVHFTPSQLQSLDVSVTRYYKLYE